MNLAKLDNLSSIKKPLKAKTWILLDINSLKDLLKQEIDLKNEYTKLTAGAKISYEGKEYNLAGLGPFHSDVNRNIRKKSYEARYGWFKDNEN